MIGKKTLIGLALIASLPALAQNARVQVIHNCADAAAEEVDVYVNGALAIDDFAFRTATPFLDLPAGVDIEVGIAPGNSTGAGDIIATFTYNLTDGETYVLVASGIVSGSGYNPAPAFDLAVFALGRESASQPGNTDVLVFHGSTDAPVVDVYESAVLNVTAADDIGYGDFAGYLELPTNDYTVQVRTSDNSAVVAAYAAPLATLGLQGAALVVVASGFLDPSQNSNGPAFGLFAALPAGGTLVALPPVSIPTARVQVIHNSADLAADPVDVYLNGALLLDDFAFRTATPFVDLQADVDLEIGIAPGNSTGAGDIIASFTYNLVGGQTYLLVANGIVSGSGYSPVQPFDLYPFVGAREAATSGAANTDLLVFHGSTDAPVVDVQELLVLGGATVISGMAYGQYAGYLEVPTADYAFQISAGGSPVVTYSAPLASLGLQGTALTVLASGFLDPTQNSNGPAFGLWVATAAGGPLLELPVYNATPSARVQVIHNSADAAASVVDVYLDGTLAIDDFAFRTATPFLDLPAGVDIEIGIAPGNSTGPGDIIATFPFNLTQNETYVVVANGIVSGSGYSPAPAFGLDVFTPAREAANGGGNTDLLVIHGSTDAPTVDVFESAVLNVTAIDDLAYGEFAGYLALPTNDYTVQVRSADNSTIVAAYGAPLATLGLQGAALTVVASGFLDPAQNSNGPAFGLFAALPAGGPLVALPSATIPTARVQVIHNSADAAAAQVDVYLNGSLLVDDFAFRTATPFVDLQAGVELSVGVAPGNSTGPGDIIASFPYNLSAGEKYILIANGIVSGSGYNPVQPFNIEVRAGARETATSGAGNTDILVFHGSTDAPVVDVNEILVLGGVTLVNDIAYGEFDGYLEPPTNNYALQIAAGGTPVVAYQAPLADLNLQGAAITVVASGFLNPAQNSNGPGFGLWVATAAGGALVELPVFTSVAEQVGILRGTMAWPVPADQVLNLRLPELGDRAVEADVLDATGRVVRTIGGATLRGTDRVEIGTGDLLPGSYFLRLISGNDRLTIPVSVMH